MCRRKFEREGSGRVIPIVDFRATYSKRLLSSQSGHNMCFTWSNTAAIPNITSGDYGAILGRLNDGVYKTNEEVN